MLLGSAHYRNFKENYELDHKTPESKRQTFPPVLVHVPRNIAFGARKCTDA